MCFLMDLSDGCRFPSVCQLSWDRTWSRSSMVDVTASKSLYMSSGSCFSGIYTITLLPDPANQPASAWADLPQGRTSTQVSAHFMASRSCANFSSATGWVSPTLYFSVSHSCHRGSISDHLKASYPFHGWVKSKTSCPALRRAATTPPWCGFLQLEAT